MTMPMPYFKTSTCGDKLKQRVALTCAASGYETSIWGYIAMRAKATFAETFPFIDHVLGDILGSSYMKIVKTDAPILGGDGNFVLPSGSIGFVLGPGAFSFLMDSQARLDKVYQRATPTDVSTGIGDMIYFTPGFYSHKITLGSSWGAGFYCTPAVQEFDLSNFYGAGSRAPFQNDYKVDGSVWSLPLPATGSSSVGKVMTAAMAGALDIDLTVGDNTVAWFPLLKEASQFLGNAFTAGLPFVGTYRSVFNIERRELTNAVTMRNTAMRDVVPWRPYPYGFEEPNLRVARSVAPPEPGTPRSLPIAVPDMSMSQVTRSLRDPGRLEALMEALRKRT